MLIYHSKNYQQPGGSVLNIILVLGLDTNCNNL